MSGQAGTGKSHFITNALRELEQDGKTVARTAKTHAASALIDGRTLDSFMRNAVQEGFINIDVLWIDEYSLIDSSQWCHLNTMLFNPEPVQIILSGDWNHLAPVDSRFKSQAILRHRVQHSLLFCLLCGGKR